MASLSPYRLATPSHTPPRSGVSNNTLVVFTADHGIFGKMSCNEAGTRVPMVVRLPGHVPAGAVVRDVTSHTDLAPTLLALAGPPLAAAHTNATKQPYCTDGADMIETLTHHHHHRHHHELPGARRATDAAAAAAAPHHRDRAVFCEIVLDRAVMTNDYTYLERGDTHREFPYSERRPAHHLAKVQMYAASDPDQLVNLAGTGLPAEAALRGTLARHNSRTNLDAAEWRECAAMSYQ